MSTLDLDGERDYWRRRLAGSPPQLGLATDRPRPTVRSRQGAALRVPLRAAVYDQVRAMARQAGAAPFVPLVATFTALLRHYTGQDDLAVGSSPGDGDAEGGFELVALRMDASGEPTFRELLARVHATVEEAFAHRGLAFHDVVEALALERTAGIHPVFQVAFRICDARRVATPGDRASPLDLDIMVIPYDDHDRPAGDGVMLVWEYSTDLFDAATMEHMAAHYARLLAQCVAHPERRLSELSPVTDRERDRLVVDYNVTAEPFADDICVHDRVAAQAARTPDAPAASGAGQALTYRALDEQANRLAHHLRALGVGPEVAVGVCLERTPELLVALLGVLKAGGAYVPMEPGFPAERQRRMLEDARAPWVITQASLTDKLVSSPARPVVLDALHLDALPSGPPASGVGPRNLAYVLFTSGSTGRPKGIQVEHRTLMNCLHWTRRAMRLGPGHNTCHLAGQSFDASVLEVWTGLATGACVHLPPEAIRASAIELQAWMLARAI
ncbi:MAG: non-ribosomal peptide synthetase, partial [Deltaproteobacteria bacterium]